MRPIGLSLAIVLGLVDISQAQSDMIWTDKPVRVDRSQQDYERLPQEVLGVEGGQLIRFPHRIDVHDSASFAADGKEYVLADLQPIARDRICKDSEGKRWPCGRAAAIFVGNLFRAKTVTCKASDGRDPISISSCRTTNRKFEQAIVAGGFAFPAVDNEELELALAAARSAKRGVWRDLQCSTAVHSC